MFGMEVAPMRSLALVLLLAGGFGCAGGPGSSPAELALATAAPDEYAAWRTARTALGSARAEAGSALAERDSALAMARELAAAAQDAATARIERAESVLAAELERANAREAAEKERGYALPTPKGGSRTEIADAHREARAALNAIGSRAAADRRAAREAAEAEKGEADAELRAAIAEAQAIYDAAGIPTVIAFEAAARSEEAARERLARAAPEAWAAFVATMEAAR